MKKNIKVNPRNLLCQYVPDLFVPEYWNNKDYPYLPDAPHVRFVENYLFGDRDLFDTDYAKWQEFAYHITIREEKNAREFVKGKIKKFTNLIESIRDKGYKKTVKPNLVEEPIWKTRYNFDAPTMYEIYNGHHRAACAIVMCIQGVVCDVYQDRFAGTHTPCNASKKIIDKKLW